jgi:prepilin-type processing-associated H-X9-DG protein
VKFRIGCLGGLLAACAVWAAIFSEIGRILLFGWIAFLGRTIPRATVNLSGVASGVVALVLLVAMVHYFGRWLVRASSAGPGVLPRPWRFRWSVSIVGSVILMFAVGYCSVGLARHLGWILSSGSMYTPRVFGTEWPHSDAKAEEARRLKELGLGFQCYDGVHLRFPAGATYGTSGEPLYSWATRILPYLSYGPSGHMDGSWSHRDKTALFRTPIREFYNPTLVDADQFDQDGFALIHYAANSNALGPDSKLMKPSDIKRDYSMILLGEVNGNFQPWGKPGNLRDPAAGINTPDGFGGAEGSGGAQFLMLDGSVRFVGQDVDPEVLRALAGKAK